MDYCHELGSKPIFIDCKIGDIDNTMQIYLKNIFEKIKADGVVVNPYMGDDVFKLADKYDDKMFLVLTKTSNKSSNIIQEQILKNGYPLWLWVLKNSMQRWNAKNNIIPILSGVEDPEYLKIARKLIPNKTPVFFAGVGSQGQDINSAKLLLNSEKNNLIINVSRDLMYHSNAKNYDEYNGLLKNKIDKYTSLFETIKNSSPGKIVILAGVSGVGKTTIIEKLKSMDNRYKYISPDITRPLRDGENDKNFVSQDLFEINAKNGKYWDINCINNIYYGSPENEITYCIKNNLIAILDYPIQKSEKARNHFGNITTIYICPPSIKELEKRLLNDNRDVDGKRLNLGKIELGKFYNKEFDSFIDFKIVSETNNEINVASQIHDFIINNYQKGIKPIEKESL